MSLEAIIGIAGVAAALIAAIVPYFLARRAGQLKKADFNLRLGYVTERGYEGPPIRHTLFWVPEHAVAGYGSIPFLIENRSPVTVAGLRLQIVIEKSCALSQEAFRELATKSDGHYFDHPFFKTRRLQYNDKFVGIEYDIGSLNPGTAHAASEPVRFGEAGEHLSFGTAFDEIARRIRALPTVLYFTTASVSCSAENLPTKSARMSLCVMALPPEMRQPLSFRGKPNSKTGSRSQVVRGEAGTAAHAISSEVWNYAQCFWFGGVPRNLLVWSLRPLAHSEGLEVVQFSQKDERIGVPLMLDLPSTIITQPINMPRKDYRAMPAEVTSIDKLIRYNGGFAIRL